jgi:1,4-dihydroxy-2-naphthoyl-CoA hydrolase
VYTYETTIKLRDTDAAGVLYFARQFDLAHDAYQAWLEEEGFGLRRIIEDADFMLAIVHAESDYAAALRVGDRIRISLCVANIGQSSFTMTYELSKEDGAKVGTAQTVHVLIDKKTRGKTPIPDDFGTVLKRNC